MDNSYRKSYTARTTRQPSGEMAKRLKADPQLSLVTLPNVVAAQGALPIKIGDDTIGAAGASGAPGGEKDEACVQAGLDKVKEQVKESVSAIPGRRAAPDPGSSRATSFPLQPFRITR